MVCTIGQISIKRHTGKPSVEIYAEQSRPTDFQCLGDDGDVVALGRLDVRLDVAILLVDDPTRRLGVEWRRFLHHLLAVERKVLEVRVIGERIRETLSHDADAAGRYARQTNRRQSYK